MSLPKTTDFNRKIVLSSLSIITAFALIGGAAFAFFSDTETSVGNVLIAGAIDLKVDNTSYYNHATSSATTWSVTDLTIEKFFDFDDIKPGDIGEDTISLHVGNNSAWLCADVTLTSNDDNTLTEPETGDGDTTGGVGEGELANRVNFIWWADDGDNVLEDDENTLPGGPLGALDVNETATVALSDSATNIWGPTPSPVPANITQYVGKAWCFGQISEAPLAQDGLGVESPRNPGNSTGGINCDGSLENNTTQTDSLTADVTFRAIQSRNNAGFLCSGQPNPPPPPPPPAISCETGDIQFASASSDNDQGLRKDSSAVLANRSVPSAAFGAPQTSGADSDVGFPVGSFFSLGFPLGGNTASIVFGFTNPFYPNPSGPDLQIFEVTGGVYPDEKVKVEASSTALGPWTVLAAAAVRDENIELGILPSAQFVRLTDVSTIGDFPNDADAYDVDAIKTFCRIVAE